MTLLLLFFYFKDQECLLLISLEMSSTIGQVPKGPKNGKGGQFAHIFLKETK